MDQYLSLVDMLDRVSRRFPDREIGFPDSNEYITLRQLCEDSRRWAAALQARGGGPGDVVALVLPTGADFLRSLFGALRAGAAFSPLPSPTSAKRSEEHIARLREVFRQDGIRYVVTRPELYDAFSRGQSQLQVLTSSGVAVESETHKMLPLSPDTLAVVQYTSGSTANSKGVSLTHSNVLASCDAVGRAMRLSPADVNVQWLPLFHDMGLIGILMFIGHGVKQYIFRPSTFVRDSAGWLQRFSELGGTIYTGPNFSYEFMLQAVTDDQCRSLDLSRWRVALNGAEHVDFGCVQRFLDRFRSAGLKPAAICPCYGLAEATVAVSIASPDVEVQAAWYDRDLLAREGRISLLDRRSKRARVLTCVGPPIPGHKVRIAAPSGRCLEEGLVGEIEVSGPAVFGGYRRRPAETDAAMRDGWLRTGDLGFVLEGQLYISGRIKETMIVRGRKFFPDDVEPIVRVLPGVYRGRCVAVPLGEMGEEQMAVIVETRIADPGQLAALITAIRVEVGTKLELADIVVLPVPARFLPQTTSGKFKRTQIRADVSKAWRGKDVFDAPWRKNVQFGVAPEIRER